VAPIFVYITCTCRTEEKPKSTGGGKGGRKGAGRPHRRPGRERRPSDPGGQVAPNTQTRTKGRRLLKEVHNLWDFLLLKSENVFVSIARMDPQSFAGASKPVVPSQENVRQKKYKR